MTVFQEFNSWGLFLIGPVHYTKSDLGVIAERYLLKWSWVTDFQQLDPRTVVSSSAVKPYAASSEIFTIHVVIKVNQTMKRNKYWGTCGTTSDSRPSSKILS
ncbi:MAG TPA: hypothetical protein VMS31_00015 [Pyrinomonadaceae bacterium]|nr:hypothetical protein [Pyrinomonadaceae bacterium]